MYGGIWKVLLNQMYSQSYARWILRSNITKELKLSHNCWDQYLLKRQRTLWDMQNQGDFWKSIKAISKRKSSRTLLLDKFSIFAFYMLTVASLPKSKKVASTKIITATFLKNRTIWLTRIHRIFSRKAIGNRNMLCRKRKVDKCFKQNVQHLRLQKKYLLDLFMAQ